MIARLWRQHHYAIIIGLLCAGYVSFLLQFYLAQYHVPDFSLYFFVAEGALGKYGAFVPHDGFSALFLHIAIFSAAHPQAISLLSLVAQGCGIFAVLYWLPKILDLNNFSKYLAAVWLFSCGLMFYFYGKLFYDFPFTLATFGIALYFLWRCVQAESVNRSYWLNWFWVALGLDLSWKPYNIFLVAGFLGLLLCNTKIRTMLRSIRSKTDFTETAALVLIVLGLYLAWKPSPYLFLISGGLGLLIYNTSSSHLGEWLKWLLYSMVGYSIGNYPLFSNLPATLQGLRAYPASSNPVSFFFTFTPKIIWDQVNPLPFNSSGMLLSSILLLVIITVVLKLWRYLIVLSCVMSAFALFLAVLSPGLPWHGFPLALFLILYFIFLLKKLEVISIARRQKQWLWPSIVVLVGIQFCYNYLWYIPKQIGWQHYTQAAVAVLERNRPHIQQAIAALTKKVDGTVYVDVAVKRQLLRPTDDATTYYRADPLVDQESLYTTYYSYPQTADYTIYVEPTIFRQLNDVANVAKYDAKTPLYSVAGDGYSIALYSNK